MLSMNPPSEGTLVEELKRTVWVVVAVASVPFAADACTCQMAAFSPAMFQDPRMNDDL